MEETEKRITEFARKNAKLLEQNHKKAEDELALEAEREEFERQGKEDRRRMIQDFEIVEEKETARVKAEIVDALVSRRLQLVLLHYPPTLMYELRYALRDQRVNTDPRLSDRKTVQRNYKG